MLGLCLAAMGCGADPGAGAPPRTMQLTGRSLDFMSALDDLHDALSHILRFGPGPCATVTVDLDAAVAHVDLPKSCPTSAGPALVGSLDLDLATRCEQTVPSTIRFDVTLNDWQLRGRAAVPNGTDLSLDVNIATDTLPTPLNFQGCVQRGEVDDTIRMDGLLHADADSVGGHGVSMDIEDLQKRGCDPYPMHGTISSDGGREVIIFSADTPSTGRLTLRSTGNEEDFLLSGQPPSACTEPALPVTGGSNCSAGCGAGLFDYGVSHAETPIGGTARPDDSVEAMLHKFHRALTMIDVFEDVAADWAAWRFPTCAILSGDLFAGTARLVYPSGCTDAAGRSVTGWLTASDARTCGDPFPGQLEFDLEIDGWRAQGTSQLPSPDGAQVDARFEERSPTSGDGDRLDFRYAGCLSRQSDVHWTANGEVYELLPDGPVRLKDLQKRDCDAYPLGGNAYFSWGETPLRTEWSPDSARSGACLLELRGLKAQTRVGPADDGSCIDAPQAAPATAGHCQGCR